MHQLGSPLLSDLSVQKDQQRILDLDKKTSQNQNFAKSAEIVNKSGSFISLILTTFSMNGGDIVGNIYKEILESLGKNAAAH